MLKTAAASLVGVAVAGCGGDGGNGGDGGDGGGGGGGDGDGGGGGDGGDGGGPTPGFDGFMSDVENYDGVADETGSSEVSVSVGAQGNGGNLAFDPAVVRVDTGTSVVWEWTGEGGRHNVAAEDGSFESDLVQDEGHTFSQTFESSGEARYACTPHRAMGMRGVVIVE